MTPLWTAEQVVEATSGKAKDSWQASGLSIDSRTLEKGDLFIALKGEQFDGHDYVQVALEAGAAAVMVSAIPEEVAEDKLLVVDDTQKALEALAVHRRKHSAAHIIAVTGSVGKTSVKEMLATVLQDQGNTHATSGNLNNHIGLPLTLARMPLDTEYGVFELGMNHAGELTTLTQMLQPHVAMITSIEAVHLEFFDSVDDIAAAKSEIFAGVVPGGHAIIPFDSRYLPFLANEASKAGIVIDNIYSFGVGKHARYRLVKGKEHDDRQSLQVDANGRELAYDLKLVGRHQALNSVGVVAALDALGADSVQAQSSFGKIEPPEGRGRRYALTMGGKQVTLIDDSYNAGPASMQAALEVLGQATGRKVAVLGDMLELGETSEALHASLATPIQKHGIDKLFTAGDFMATLHQAVPEAVQGKHCSTAKDLLPALEQDLEAGDTVLIKGSHGSNMWQLAASLREYKG